MSEETYHSAIAAELACVPSASSTVAIDVSDDDEEFDCIGTIEEAEKVGKSWVVEIPVIGEILEQLAKRQGVSVFQVEALPGRLFATTEQLLPGKSTVIVKNGVVGTVVEGVVLDDRRVVTKRVTKVLKTDEERFVLGVVLVPETKDSQGDVYSHHEVRKAAHQYMEKAGALGKQHSEIVTGKLKVIENYIAPVDFEQDGESVVQGTWLMGIRVVDDDLWADIKKGSFTGFSIGGEAFRRPEVTEVASD